MSEKNIKSPRPSVWARAMDVRWRLALAIIVGVAAALLAPHLLGTLARVVVGWVGFAATDLALIILGMWQADTDDIRRVAASEDLPRTQAFVLVVGAAMASLGAVVGLMGSLKGLSKDLREVHVILSVAAVVLAWTLVHLVFTLRYAHSYYDADEDTGLDTGGLVFPDDQGQDKGPKLTPNYVDFAYFSFIIGMTAQTADIGIGNRGLRAAALLHGLIAFIFNTVIVALTIGTIGGMLN
ncbi:DUF1345 domain-containing protein [Microvirga sp. STS02]|uniref:DUF1345 domain-containing protein n=1 Tax=Hymenobacter negativus TaxID=2795026 RepID=UPI0018DE7920|nr:MULTISPECIES: DUF1345 domain-containing protein [Bacteria]MBH8568556.1 DUF1345 domain-containing protein [Hymenobacter negativus]MBR7208290.1 DUF1345 domain-containing protein [Microvirga sp. STS02]